MTPPLPDQMNSTTPTHVHDRLAAYALDAVDEGERLDIDAILAASPQLASYAADLEQTAGELGALARLRPPFVMRPRVLSRAVSVRLGNAVDPLGAVEMHQIECARFDTLTRRLGAEQWATEVVGAWTDLGHHWTVQQVAGHVSATERLLAERLGAAPPAVPEAELGDDHGIRGLAAAARHATVDPLETLTELQSTFAATQSATATLTPAALENEIRFYGVDMRLSTALILLSFEKWIHADDVRQAIGLVPLPPPTGSIATMCDRAVRLVPLSLAVADVVPPDATLVIQLTGAGGGGWAIDLRTGETRGGPGRAAITVDAATATSHPATTLAADAVEWCRAFADRLDPVALTVDVDGDRELARAVIDNISNLVGV